MKWKVFEEVTNDWIMVAIKSIKDLRVNGTVLLFYEITSYFGSFRILNIYWLTIRKGCRLRPVNFPVAVGNVVKLHENNLLNTDVKYIIFYFLHFFLLNISPWVIIGVNMWSDSLLIVFISICTAFLGEGKKIHIKRVR